MFTSLLGLPLFPWTPVQGFALKDVNFQNFRYLNHFAKNNMAQSVPEYDRIQDRFQGIPWVNSIAADRRGRAYYSMDGAIPNVPDSKADRLLGPARPRAVPAHRDPRARRHPDRRATGTTIPTRSRPTSSRPTRSPS